MLGQLVVLLLIPFELFALPTPHGTENLLLTSLIIIVTLHHAKILITVYYLAIRRIDMTLAKREIMNGIQ